MQTGQDQQSSAAAAGHASLKGVKRGREAMRLRLLFLVPLLIAILTIIAALTFALYQHEHKSVQKGVIRIRASARDFYEESIRYDASALQAVMDMLKHDHTLYAALASRDRQRLLDHTAILFAALKKDFAITHFYFAGTDRVNLLRVHAPHRYGDVINRVTTLFAERDGTTAFGVEMGPLGTFTLRLVAPWYEETTQQLIGYVELGMEIDRVLQKLRDFFGVEVIVLIHKDQLDQKQWEDGMHTLGRTPDWDRFPSVVVGSQSPKAVSPLIAKHLGHDELSNANTILKAVQGGASYRIAFLPLQDAAGHNVAHMVLLADVSQETDAALSTVYTGSLTALAVGILLIGFFYWQVGRIGRRIDDDEQALEELATRDGLTGLYNHRTFYTFLEDEIARGHRYRHTLNLLMIDIDHFKHVNDTYGHQAGDAILRSLSERLSNHVRAVDRVCRYGGEEIAVLLPDSDATLGMAERLCAGVEATPFDIGEGKAISITVSIGLACFPANADTAPALVSAADTALYAAKEGGRNRVCVSRHGI